MSTSVTLPKVVVVVERVAVGTHRFLDQVIPLVEKVETAICAARGLRDTVKAK
ncbi:hypothetical protein [Streptomyces prunicolor]|uniref:hypothetical protein n=1 Tax=Streptomyces prunicolor TaxID=67348 RepID=UPI0003814A0F|nr:hypothetical protein [Streptomyces prunicolor]